MLPTYNEAGNVDSHDPRDLRRLVEASKRADLVLGSRYVPGGGVEDWSLVRQGISRGGSAYARLVLGIEIKDLTGGFKCPLLLRRVRSPR